MLLLRVLQVERLLDQPLVHVPGVLARTLIVLGHLMLAVAVSAVLRKAPSKGSQEDAGVALAGDMGCGDRNRFLSIADPIGSITLTGIAGCRACRARVANMWHNWHFTHLGRGQGHKADVLRPVALGPTLAPPETPTLQVL
eukprot:CAMPEP_0181471558 /NCGR_PEP_ID=MMETSP1110-20121109/39136_1 /TAXON_ID=174948 /ORGANISM="Symbiodinium sp., Strain CCMP421" /LENGTH=140 /DNA_ID=CAMNT_0023596579 /DNA_START=168 /DNA_END=590 /DNA_ORIENTATION=-